MLKFLVVMTGTSATVGAAFRRCRRCLVSHIHPWQQAVMGERPVALFVVKSVLSLPR